MTSIFDLGSIWSWLSVITSVVFGWLSGALVNYLSDVLPLRRTVTTPFCTHCQEQFPWFNYLVWPRRCLGCAHQRSARVWITEFVFVYALVVIVLRPPERLGVFAGWLWLVYFGVITIIDLEHHLILHPVSLVGAVGGLLTGWWIHGIIPTLIGGIAGFGIMWTFYAVGAKMLQWFNRRRKTQENSVMIDEDEAIGFGDVNLSGVIGLLLGWPGVLAGLILAILLGGAGSLVALGWAAVRGRYHPGLSIPYGPFLALSTIILLYR